MDLTALPDLSVTVLALFCVLQALNLLARAIASRSLAEISGLRQRSSPADSDRHLAKKIVSIDDKIALQQAMLDELMRKIDIVYQKGNTGEP